MKDKINWKNLDWDTYKEIDNQNDLDFLEPVSGLTYLSWKYYGLNIEFAFYKKSILIIGSIDENFYKIKRDEFINDYLYKNHINKIIFRPYFIDENIDELIDICIERLGKNNKILFENFFESDLKNLNNKIHLWNWISNFIYSTEKLKTFSGKSLQKKRNLLNYYNNNYSNDSKIEIINSDNINKILNYINNENKNNKFIDIEIKFYIDFIKNFDPNNMKGSILYYKNKIIGFTIGYIRKNYYEIFIEKCDKNLKGSYQYLISMNLLKNNISTLYIDRQDGASVESLIKSKKSYKPIKIYERNVYYIENFN